MIEGVAQLATLLPDGRRQMVGLLFPSDFVGRPGRSRIDYDIVAATAVTLCMFRKADFERLLRAHPALERRLLEMTLDELDAAREWMLLLGRKTAREKVASLILLMARRDAALTRRAPLGRPARAAAPHPPGDRRLPRADHRDRQPPARRHAPRRLLDLRDQREAVVRDLARLRQDSGDSRLTASRLI